MFRFVLHRTFLGETAISIGVELDDTDPRSTKISEILRVCVNDRYGTTGGCYNHPRLLARRGECGFSIDHQCNANDARLSDVLDAINCVFRDVRTDLENVLTPDEFLVLQTQLACLRDKTASIRLA